GASGQVRISFTCPAAPVVNAGPDQNLVLCSTTTTLFGSSVPTCMTGQWSVIAGTATISAPTSPTSGVTGIVPGTPVTLRWTITNPNCGTYFDDVIINSPIGPGCWNYCASNATSLDYSYISNVTFNTINNSSSGCASYTNFTNITTTVLIGQSYNLTISKLNCTNATLYTGRFAAWIDWNNDGDFADAGEQVLTDAAASNGPITALVTVPAGAVIGTTRMRCIFREGTTAPTSCGAYATWGETEDYSLNIQNLVACTGTPTPATISPANFSGNPGQVVTYTWNGVPQTGYTYQWQQSASSTGPWTNIAGATNITYTTDIINVTTYYRLLITCTNSGLSAATNPAELLIVVNYCTYPTISCASGQQITRVILNNLDNTSGTTCTATGFQDFTNLISNLLIGNSYTMSVYTGTGPNVTSGNPQYQHSMGVWIDFNQNGSFYDSGEFFLFGQNTVNPNSIVTGTIAVPPTTLAGNTRMRVKYTLDQTMLSAWACINNPTLPPTYGGEV
ncbi:MAG: GEVED domain-containing protein, partial [Flavobacteriales bacterium]